MWRQKFEGMFAARHTHILTPYIPLPHAWSHPIHTISTHNCSHITVAAQTVWSLVCRTTHAQPHSLHATSTHMFSGPIYISTHIFAHPTVMALIFLQSCLPCDTHILSRPKILLPQTWSRALYILYIYTYMYIYIYIFHAYILTPTVVAQKVWSHVCSAPKTRRKRNAALHLSAASQCSGV